jgi:glutamyl-tRNA synthetase
MARRQEGVTVLRVEDLDRPRVVPGAEERQADDLAWLGLDWDESPSKGGPFGPYRQTERTAFYEDALRALTAIGRTYLCDCSRAEIARVASAPHAGDEIVYPGTCRDKDSGRELRRPAAVRLRIEEKDEVSFEDGVVGAVCAGVLQRGGDFVLRRGDGVFAYQLAVAADDLSMAITDVVRGDDLVASTPRQLLLMRLWRMTGAVPWAKDRTPPRYWHLPLVRDGHGERLAKRTPRATVRELRAAGRSPHEVVGMLAHALGLAPTEEPVEAARVVRESPSGAVLRPRTWHLR